MPVHLSVCVMCMHACDACVQVPVPEEQHRVMIEAVENHMPQVRQSGMYLVRQRYMLHVGRCELPRHTAYAHAQAQPLGSSFPWRLWRPRV